MGTPAANSSLLVQFHNKLMSELTGPMSVDLPEIPHVSRADSSGEGRDDGLKLGSVMGSVRDRIRSANGWNVNTSFGSGNTSEIESGSTTPKAGAASPDELQQRGRIRRPSESIIDASTALGLEYIDKQRQAGADGGMLASKGILLDLLQLDLTRYTRPAYDITNGDALLASYLGLPALIPPSSQSESATAAGEGAAQLAAELAAERERAAAAEEEAARLREAMIQAEAEKEEATRKLRDLQQENKDEAISKLREGSSSNAGGALRRITSMPTVSAKP